ncbi:monocarboxylate transporter 12-like [Tubulanus polymorphus]|uniref:monocarboxylate transporter 12-like n=1 Tax=Tubulanus polymorphus TaxID=672921 RepID=UPI003DA52E9D
MKKDKGWGWMIVLAAFVFRIFSYGLTTSAGMIYVVFKEEFQQSSGSTAIVSSLISASGYLSGPVSGIMCDRLGYRIVTIISGIAAGTGLILSAFAPNIQWLILTYGLISGIGFGLGYVPSSVVCAFYFEKKQNLAMGLASCGGGVGSFIFPPFLQLLLNTYGWKGSLLLSGALAYNIVVCGVLMIPYKESTSATEVPVERTSDVDGDVTSSAKDKCCESFHWKIWRNINFLVLFSNNVLVCFGFSIIYVHVAAFSQKIGLDSNSAAWILTTIGAMSMLGKFTLGVLANHPRVSEHLLYILPLGVGGVVTVVLPYFPHTLVSMLAYAILIGLSLSVLGGALLPALLLGYCGKAAISASYGCILMAEGIGFLAGAPFAGLLYDVTNNYDLSFQMAGCVICLGALLMFVPWRLSRTKQPDLEMATVS